MIVFNVVKEHHGWAVRMGELMTTPFWSRDLAVLEANRLAASIRRHGERAEVVVESLEPREAPAKRQIPSSIGSELVADGRVTSRQ
jgi:hypothetical protein